MKKLLLGTILLALGLVFPIPTMARVDVDISISLPPPIVFAAPPEVVLRFRPNGTCAEFSFRFGLTNDGTMNVLPDRLSVWLPSWRRHGVISVDRLPAKVSFSIRMLYFGRSPARLCAV